MHTDTTTRPEVAHDEHLLELLHAEWIATQDAGAIGGRFLALAGSYTDLVPGIDRRSANWTIRRTHYVRTGTEAPAVASDAVPVVEALALLTVEALPWDRRHAPAQAGALLAAAREARSALRAAHAAVVAHEAGYTGWSRFWLVTSSAGHVHSSTECSSCRPTTTFAAVPSLSGLDEAAAVEALGETLCTVCFPSAPARPAKVTQAQALRLLADGEEAFVEARAKAKAKRG